MSAEKNELPLGSLLKTVLRERSLSMRKLSELTAIDTATISRIANGKQPANARHLQRIAHALNLPIGQLFSAAGFEVENPRQEIASDIHAVVDNIQDVLKSSNLFSGQCTSDRVEQELFRYEQYARTEEGERIIREDFLAKVNQVSGAGPFIEQLKQMHKQFCTDDIMPDERTILGSALLYFILSTDIIPDYVFPIGYLDDAIAVRLVSNRLSLIKKAEPHAKSPLQPRKQQP
jgi:transcriptional regulator with XRE-family HTH domain